MASTFDDIDVTSAWQDITATYASMASTSSFIENKRDSSILIVFSASPTAPTGNNGSELTKFQTAYGTAAHIWVRSVGKESRISCGLTD